jgi:hypothetical protein
MVIIEYTAIQLNHREEKNINLRMYLVIAAHAFCVKKSLQELFYHQPVSKTKYGYQQEFRIILYSNYGNLKPKFNDG